MRERISRTREQILEEAKEMGLLIKGSTIWVVCDNCGGTGDYPSAMIPAGKCRHYCWKDRTPETYGKLPISLEKYVKREQARDRREHHAEAKAQAKAQEKEARVSGQVETPEDLQLALDAAGFSLQEAVEMGWDREQTRNLTWAEEVTLDMARRWAATGQELSEKQTELLKTFPERIKRERQEQEQREKEQEQRKQSEWIGQVGEKVEALGEVIFEKQLDSQWGTTHLIKVRTDDGNEVTWFASDVRPVDKGDRIIMKGTIKKLDTYQAVKQTILTRCKLYHEDGTEKTWEELGL